MGFRKIFKLNNINKKKNIYRDTKENTEDLHISTFDPCP